MKNFKFIIAFFFINSTFAFNNLILNSLNLVKDYSIKYNIDKSHNEHHSKEVLFWALDIMESEQKKYSKSEINIIIQSCILHDLADHKYTYDDEFVKSYLSDLHNDIEIETIMNIINTMSYSKTFKNNMIVFPYWIKESIYSECFHVTREADLLSSYNIARMIEYRKNQDMSDEFIKKEVPIFYYSRMAKLTENNFFVHNWSKKRANELDSIARLKLNAIQNHNLLLDNLDYFRFIDFIDEKELSYRFCNLLRK